MFYSTCNQPASFIYQADTFVATFILKLECSAVEKDKPVPIVPMQNKSFKGTS